MRRSLSALSLCLCLAGCSEEATDERSEPTSDQAPETPTEAAAEPDPDPEPWEDEEEALPEAQPGAQAEAEAAPSDQELEDLTETLRAASTAAETYESGSTICEAAHASIVAMMEAVAERYPDQVRDRPAKGAFVQACEQLPEEAQECLLPRHAMAHTEDCAAITARLDPEQRAYLDRVLGGG